jgi:hypothetical protein
MKKSTPLGEKEHTLIERNLELIFEFEKYVLNHPQLAERIPNDALLVLQLEGDETFNRWSRKMAEGQREKDQPLVYITVKRLAPVRSRIQRLELQQVG